MVALAYDAALRREELCTLQSDDVDPAHRMLRLRAETTKGHRQRTVPTLHPLASCFVLTLLIEEPLQNSVAPCFSMNLHAIMPVH